MEPRFKPGDRVVHVTDSAIPEGTLGTVLGPVLPEWGLEEKYKWEVEYDGHPGPFQILRPGRKSLTSWMTRDTSIELTREEALKRARQGQP